MVDVSLVSVLATVTTPDGNWVPGLNQDDFQLYEDGKPQEIKVFGKESELPLQLCLLFDSSSSIATELRTQQEAAIQFLASIIRPVDRVSILRVSEDVDEVVRATNRIDRLSSAIRSIRPGGGTSLYDAIYLAAEILGNVKGRKVIVAITDGTDTTSDLKINDCLKQAQIAEAAIYGLVVQPIKSEPGRNLGGEHAMHYLAEKDRRPVLPGAFTRVDSNLLRQDQRRTANAVLPRLLSAACRLGVFGVSSNPGPREGSFPHRSERVKDTFHAGDRAYTASKISLSIHFVCLPETVSPPATSKIFVKNRFVK